MMCPWAHEARHGLSREVMKGTRSISSSISPRKPPQLPISVEKGTGNTNCHCISKPLLPVFSIDYLQFAAVDAVSCFWIIGGHKELTEKNLEFAALCPIKKRKCNFCCFTFECTVILLTNAAVALKFNRLGPFASVQFGATNGLFRIFNTNLFVIFLGCSD